jgi:hypothetical protein
VIGLDNKDDVVRLRLPTDPFSQQIIRLAVYMVASRMDFNLADLEDLRIAVDEASGYTLAQTADEGIIQVELASTVLKDCPTSLAIPASLSRLIMESVVDGVDIKNEDDICRIALRKKSPSL